MLNSAALTEAKKAKNQIGSPIQTEHGRRVLAALEDFHRGRKDIPRRCVAFQLGLFNDGKAFRKSQKGNY